MNCSPNALLAASVQYRSLTKSQLSSSIIYLLCEWANNLEPPTVKFSWSPPTAILRYFDSGGLHFGDLANFNANADIPTVTLVDFTNEPFTSISGLSALPSLTTFNGGDIWTVTNLDFSGCNNINSIGLDLSTTITDLIVNNLPSLTSLTCPLNQLTTLDVSGDTSLATLDCSSNASLTTLTLTGCTALTTLDCSGCAITSIASAGTVAMSQFTMNGTTGAGALTINGMPHVSDILGAGSAVTSLSFPDLIDCTFIPGAGAIDFNSCPSMTAASFASLTGVAMDFSFGSCPNLTSLSVPVLASINEDFELQGCNITGNLNLSALTYTGGNWYLQNNPLLTSITFNAGIVWGGTGAGAFTWDFSGCGLNQANVDLILQIAVSRGMSNGDVLRLNGGTNSPPTGGILNADYVTLIGNSAVVFIN